MQCRNCGSLIVDGSQFCTTCGAKQEFEQQNVAQKPPVQQQQNYQGAPQETQPVQQQQNYQGTPQGTQPVYQQQNYQGTPQGTQPVQQQQNYQGTSQGVPSQPYGNAYQQNPYGQNGYNPGYPGQGVPNVEPGELGVSFGKAIKLFFTNYVNFTGRSTRGEYWWITLFNVLISVVVSIISNISFELSTILSVILILWLLATLIPGLALIIRRLHDIGKSWPWIFMGLIPIAGPIILIVFYCTQSGPANQWGPAPVDKRFQNY